LDWIEIKSEQDLNTISEESFQHNLGVAIFKHSTRCSISSVAKTRLASFWDFKKEELPIYYLDLITYRNLSNLIAERFGIQHESPQLIVIKNGEVVYHASHLSISVKSLHQELENKA
jgi:bacillithiol system protein YtxJ